MHAVAETQLQRMAAAPPPAATNKAKGPKQRAPGGGTSGRGKKKAKASAGQRTIKSMFAGEPLGVHARLRLS
jgi:hypothetical protein